MNSQTHTILDQMGITTWQATMELPGSKLVARKETCWFMGDNNYLIVENGDMLNADESLLLANMLKSVDLQIQSEQLQSAIPDGACCIVMQLNDDFLPKERVYCFKIAQITHPKSLLEGSSKKQAWQQLQQFIG